MATEKLFSFSKEFTDKGRKIYLYLLLTVFPLAIVNYSSVTKLKFGVFFFLTLFLLLFCVFAEGGRMLGGEKVFSFSLKRDLPLIFLGLYILSMLISQIFTEYKGLKNADKHSAFLFGSGRYEGFIVFLLYAVCFIIFRNSGKLKKSVPLVSAVTLFIMSVIGIFQFYGVNLFGFYGGYKGTLGNFVSTVGNIDMFSGICCIFIPVIAGYYILSDTCLYEKLILGISLAVSFYLFLLCNVSSGKAGLIGLLLIAVPLFVTDSVRLSRLFSVLSVLSLSVFVLSLIPFSAVKSAVSLALTLIFAGVSAVSGRRDFKIGKKARVIIFIGEIAAAVLFLALIYFFGKAENGINKSLFGEIYDVLHGRADLTTGSYRLGVWKYALDMGAEHPIFGTGVGTFMSAFSIYTKNLFINIGAGVFDSAHNEYIQIFCVTGLLGLLSYLGFVVSVLAGAVKRLGKTKTAVAFLPAVCYLIQAFFSFSIVIVAPFFWTALGILDSEE